MSDSESIKKMLRSVLQASKHGVSINCLQSEYHSLCGQPIPYRQLGYPTMEAYLRSIPFVVRLEQRMGELICFAGVCEETAHIAQLVARQKNPKKHGRSRVVNCRMRSKASNPYMFYVKPKSILRQPAARYSSGFEMNRIPPHSGYGRFSAPGNYRTEKRLNILQKPTAPSLTERPATPIPVNKTKTVQVQSSVYDVMLTQRRLALLLAKYTSGLWLSKLPLVYKEMFSQQLHPKALLDLENWTQICSLEKPGCINRVDRLVYPPDPPKPSTASPSVGTHTCTTVPASPKPVSTFPTAKPPLPLPPCSVPKQPSTPPIPLAKFTFPVTPQPPVSGSLAKPLCPLTLRSATPQVTPSAKPLTPNGKARSPVSNPASFGFPSGGQAVKPPSSTATFSFSSNPAFTSPPNSLPHPTPPLPPPSSFQLHSTAKSKSDRPPSPAASSPAISADLHAKLKELLAKYSQGLWAQALPQLFMEAYKIPFPEHVLANLSLLLDMCTVQYPMPGNKRKAILYSLSAAELDSTMGQGSQTQGSPPAPSGLRVLASARPPSLELPKEQYPSVLVTDVKNSYTVTVRLVGEGYSKAQESMEEAMRSFYRQNPALCSLSNLMIGQLAALRVDGGEDVARVQVMELTSSDKVKVYYMDEGYTEETSRSWLLELPQVFLSLPFQATNVRLAGLDTLVSPASVMSTLERLAVEKILLMETVERHHQSGTPLVVLYDTSQGDDININVACLKALQDRTLDSSLAVNSTYQNVCVTTVCPDGTLYCQMPSRGTLKLDELLNKIEAFYSSQVTSESLVSRPFCGKFCLVRYKGKWSRVEITNLHGSRVMDVELIDLGVQSSCEVTELRETPAPFLQDLLLIPPQAIKCCLADLSVPAGNWKSEAIFWLKEAIMHVKDWSVKIVKVEQEKEGRLVHIYLFAGADAQEVQDSVNHQLAKSELWRRQTEQNNNINTTAAASSLDNMASSSLDAVDVSRVEKLSLNSPNPPLRLPSLPRALDMPLNSAKMPPLLELPQPGENMDVYVPVACHPGHFVVQPWQEMYKLVVLMGEMILYYNKTEGTAPVTQIQKGEIYAAKVDKNWHRVLVNGVLTNRLVSVYELDYGKHELVSYSQLQPLIEEFRHLPFQAITAQLAGVKPRKWSEETSMVFRNHVEKRALVAQVESVPDGAGSKTKGQAWERRITVYLVDTSQDDRDVWIHNLIADVADKLSSPA